MLAAAHMYKGDDLNISLSSCVAGFFILFSSSSSSSWHCAAADNTAGYG
jgi:hypothetical protein